MILKCETTLWRWQPPDEAHYVIVGGRVTLACSSDQTLACIHFTSKVTRPLWLEIFGVQILAFACNPSFAI